MIAVVVVLAVALADATIPPSDTSWLTAQFVLALATFVTAVGGVIALFKKTSDAKAVTEDTNAKVAQVANQTNGQSAAMQARLEFLEHELAGVAHRPAPRSPFGTTGPPGPVATPPKV